LLICLVSWQQASSSDAAFAWVKGCADFASQLAHQKADFKAWSSMPFQDLLNVIKASLPSISVPNAANLASYIKNRFERKTPQQIYRELQYCTCKVISTNKREVAFLLLPRKL
jgi:hypothetical protein